MNIRFLLVSIIGMWFFSGAWAQSIKVANGVHGYSLEVPKNFVRVTSVDFDLYAKFVYDNPDALARAKKMLAEGDLDIVLSKEDSTFIKVSSENIKVDVDETFKTIIRQQIPQQYLLVGRTDCTIESCDFKKVNNRNILLLELSYIEQRSAYTSIVGFLNGRDNVFTVFTMTARKNNEKKYNSVFKKIIQTLIIK